MSQESHYKKLLNQLRDRLENDPMILDYINNNKIEIDMNFLKNYGTFLAETILIKFHGTLGREEERLQYILKGIIFNYNFFFIYIYIFYIYIFYCGFLFESLFL